jgi:demethylmenaquinone methyltransferase/2-methoxy-6-polyprenyl-1,4-benzoquinol methylase
MTERTALTTGAQRKSYVKKMFNAIAHRYDLLNHLLSFGLDIHWRRKAISKIDRHTSSGRVLDLACGTGDFAHETAKRRSMKVVGADIALGMLKVSRKKRNPGRVMLLNADGEQLPLRDHCFEAVTIAFGIRNMGDMQAALSEMHRILEPEGQCIILEFSLPRLRILRAVYLLYFNHVLPLAGRLVSGHQDAYSYLPASVDAFPEKEQFVELMKKSGFTGIEYWSLMAGVAVIYKGYRR